MVEVLGGPKQKFTGDILPWLAKGRTTLLKQPDLLEKARSSLEARSIAVDPDVYRAVQGIEVRGWVYLRDTVKHSIFLDPSTDRAYGVLGLTQGIREVAGGSGVVVETGLVRYLGRTVCDGVITRALWLGPSYRKSFNQKLRRLREEGKLYV
jgi:hypothetical protein